MKINITGRNIKIDDTARAHIDKNIAKLERLASRIVSVDIILEEQRAVKKTEVMVNFAGHRLISKESSTDIYASVELAMDNMKRQLEKLHDKLLSQRKTRA